MTYMWHIMTWEISWKEEKLFNNLSVSKYSRVETSKHPALPSWVPAVFRGCVNRRGNKISRRLSESRIIFYSSPHLQRTFSSLLLAICIQFFITAEFIHFNINLKTKLIGKKYNNLQCRSISSQSRYNFDTSKRCCPPVGGQSGVKRNLTAKKQLQ